MSFIVVRWQWVSEPAQTHIESFDTQAQAKRWMSEMGKRNVKHPDEDQIFVLDTVPSMPIPKALKKTYPYGRDNPRESEWQVVRQSWGNERVIGTFSTKAEAEKERRAWEEQTLEDFKVGRIMYDYPYFVLVETRRRTNPSWAKVFG